MLSLAVKSQIWHCLITNLLRNLQGNAFFFPFLPSFQKDYTRCQNKEVSGVLLRLLWSQVVQ